MGPKSRAKTKASKPPAKPKSKGDEDLLISASVKPKASRKRKDQPQDPVSPKRKRTTTKSSTKTLQTHTPDDFEEDDGFVFTRNPKLPADLTVEPRPRAKRAPAKRRAPQLSQPEQEPEPEAESESTSLDQTQLSPPPSSPPKSTRAAPARAATKAAAATTKATSRKASAPVKTKEKPTTIAAKQRAARELTPPTTVLPDAVASRTRSSPRRPQQQQQELQKPAFSLAASGDTPLRGTNRNISHDPTNSYDVYDQPTTTNTGTSLHSDGESYHLQFPPAIRLPAKGTTTTTTTKASTLSRRSSLGNRGKRLSSIGNGFVAGPHEDVSPRDFYKHLDPEAPDPHRMKQMMIWCCKRVLDAHTQRLRKLRERSRRANADETTATSIAKVIEEELIRDLVQGKVSTTWWNRPEEDTSTRKQKPNAHNITNLENLQAFEAQLRDLDKEKAQWLSQLDRVRKARPSLPATVPLDVAMEAQGQNDVVDTKDDPKARGLIRDLLAGESANTISNLFTATKDKCQSLEQQVDKLYDAIYRMKSLSEATRMYLEGKNHAISDSLRNAAAGDEDNDISVRDVLRALSRHELERV